MMNTAKILWSRAALIAVVLLALVFAIAPMMASAKIVDHPDKLKYKDLDYQPPQAADYRHTLKCGATVYVAENPEVPTIDLTVIVRAGSMYEPVEKAGVSDMTGYLMRNGGVEGMTAKQLDERLAFLAGDISVSIGSGQGTASLFCLSKDLDEGLDLFGKVLRTPQFDQEALDRYRADVLSDLSQRNNSTSAIESREWAFLVYGDHPSTNQFRRTESSVNGITRDDLIAYHKQYFFPKNFILSVAGDFKTDDILAKLDALLAGWPDHDLQLPEVSAQIPEPKPGIYMIRKDDVNQSRIRIGHLGIQRDNPDEYAIDVMNNILGGGGFTSRIVRRVRSDEGLAYSAGSRFDTPVLYPGTFRAYFQTKHSTAAFGTRLIVDEINRIRDEKCESEPVENAKSSIISDLVNPFSSKTAIVATFASDQYTNRPDDYWQNYTKNVEAVTVDAVQQAAEKYLHPDKLIYLVVGNPEEAEAGDDKHPDKFSDFGEITVMELRDPMTLEMK